MKSCLLVFLGIVIISSTGYSQSKNVLFLGNSYTFYNNLPQLVANLSKSAGKTVDFEYNAPGGYTIQAHLTNIITMDLIRQGKWDIVILQEQSQIPTIDYYRYNMMYPAMISISDSIRKYNKCATIVTFMSWGRKNGGQQCDQNKVHCSPVFVDFSHMQDSLESAFTDISDKISACIAPIGIVWKNALKDKTIELHDYDEGHPNFEGSYLSACVLYSVIWNDSPLNIKENSNLPNDRANFYKTISDEVVFNSSKNWNMHLNYPIAEFSFSFDDGNVVFNNTSKGDDSVEYLWNFGDGNNSNLKNPSHKYQDEGIYDVTLIVSQCNKNDTARANINTSIMNIPDSQKSLFDAVIYPNPSNGIISILSDKQNYTYYKVFNELGVVVKSGDLSTRNQQILVSDISNGLYFIELSDRNFFKGYSKFIKYE